MCLAAGRPVPGALQAERDLVAECLVAKNREPTEGVIMIGPLAVELRGRWTDRKDLRACSCRCRVANGERAKVIATIQIDGGHHYLPHGNRVPV